MSLRPRPPERTQTKNILRLVARGNVAQLIGSDLTTVTTIPDPLEIGKGYQFSGINHYHRDQIDDNLLRSFLTPEGKWWIMRSIWPQTTQDALESGEMIQTKHGAMWKDHFTLGTVKIVNK